MALTVAEQVRLRIQDKPTVFDQTLIADGSANTYALHVFNVTSGTAFVPAGGTWSATGATFDVSGYVTFATVPSGQSLFRARGVHSVFSDAEVEHFMAAGSVAGAALEAVRSLMFDSLKRAKWAAPDGTQYDDTAAQGQLQKLHDQLVAEVASEGAGGGGFISWAEGQGDYW